MRRTDLLAFAACSLAFISPMSAAGTDFGTVTSEGEFRLNQSRVRGHATLIDAAAGNVVETFAAPSRLRLHTGASIELRPQSRAKVYGDRLVLEQGSGELTISRGFAVEARSLRISPSGTGTRGSIGLHKNNAVQVAALTGRFRVHTASGILVSSVEAGMAVEFEPQVAGQAPPSSFIGCILKKEDKWIVYDTTVRITAELRGTGFEREWGNRCQVNGTARAVAQPAGGNVQVLDVTSVLRIESGGCSDVAKALNAELPPGAQQAQIATAPPGAPTPTTGGGGMSAGTKVAIVSGVIAGGGAGAYLATKKDRSK